LKQISFPILLIMTLFSFGSGATEGQAPRVLPGWSLEDIDGRTHEFRANKSLCLK